jgi:hypothetical protein
MWTHTPTYAVVMLFLTWMFLCLVRIWSLPFRPTAGTTYAALYLLLTRCFHLFFAFMGLYLIDLACRICFLGLFDYGRVGYIAAPVLLCAAVGAAYILCGMLAAPTRGMLLVFGVMAAAYLSITLLMPSPPLRLALYAGGALAFPITLIELFLMWRNGRSSRDRNQETVQAEAAMRSSGKKPFLAPVWDLSRTRLCAAGWKTHAAMLILIGVEFVLHFEGMTLLLWL